MIDLPLLPDDLAHLGQSVTTVCVSVLVQTTFVLLAGLAVGWLAGRFGSRHAANGPLLRAAVYRVTLIAVAIILLAAPFNALSRKDASAAPRSLMTIQLPGLPERFRIALATLPPFLAESIVVGRPQPAHRVLIVRADSRVPQDHVFIRTSAGWGGNSAAAVLPLVYTGLALLYYIGLGLGLLSLLAGRAYLRRLAVVSTPLPNTHPLSQTFSALCSNVPGQQQNRLPHLLIAPGGAGAPFLADASLLLSHPVLFLPAESMEWTEEEAQAILAHEAAHLLRRDGSWLLFASLLRASLWPQPLLALLVRRLEEATEEACDAEAVASGACRAPVLARLLLATAERQQREVAAAAHFPLLGRWAAAPALGVVSSAAALRFRSSLGRRMSRLLEDEGSSRSGSPALTAALSAALFLGAGSVSLAALHSVSVETTAMTPALPSILQAKISRLDTSVPLRKPRREVTVVRVEGERITVTGRRRKPYNEVIVHARRWNTER